MTSNEQQAIWQKRIDGFKASSETTYSNAFLSNHQEPKAIIWMLFLL